MTNFSLQLFCNRVVAAQRITKDDARELADDILADGLACRDDADLLIALDRAVADRDDGYADLLVALIVDFAVWGERPAGYVDPDLARWLAASLGAGAGPTPLAARIAMAVIQEAHASDEHFIAFALSAKSKRKPASKNAELPALAA